jgi:hypothetical protein
MECLFEVIFQLLGEVLLGGAFEALAELVGRFISWVARGFSSAPADPPRRAHHLRLGRLALWLLGGVACGFLSLLVMPAAVVKVPALQVVNLVLTPFLMAALAVQTSRLLLPPPKPSARARTPQEHFAGAYVFALVYLLVRFIFAK